MSVKKLFLALLCLFALLVLMSGCYSEYTQTDEDVDEAYQKGYDQGYREGYEAGQLSILEGDDEVTPTTRTDTQNYFVTESGKCFHLPSCQYRDKAVYWYKTREGAIADGYRPCSKCGP